MNEILAVLKELRVPEYRLKEEIVHGKEWFFIRKKLDMSRAKKVKYYYLTVYVPIYDQQTRYKGQASMKISGIPSHHALVEMISGLVKEASLIKNPYFELPTKQEMGDVEFTPIGNIQDVFEMMDDFHESEELSLNSYELFETFREVHIINSKGVDVSYVHPSHQLELVINAKANDHEIEIYQDLRFGNPSIADLKRRIGDACRQALDRKDAVETSKLQISHRVILSNEQVLKVMRYYLSQLNVDMIYKKYSDVHIGQELGPEGFRLEGLVSLENSSRNIPYDEDGRLIQNVVLVDQGKVQHVWGAHEASMLLSIEETTMIHNFKVASGSMSLEDIRSQPYLELVQFSDFSVNPITGDFAGEIRLGYYFDGQTITPVTGGSLSGNIKENEPTMILSKELVKYDNAVVPQAIVLDHVSVSV